nr:MAG TPA: hypothetical protein [Caudoviricetes sp.]
MLPASRRTGFIQNKNASDLFRDLMHFLIISVMSYYSLTNK